MDKVYTHFDLPVVRERFTAGDKIREAYLKNRKGIKGVPSLKRFLTAWAALWKIDFRHTAYKEFVPSDITSMADINYKEVLRLINLPPGSEEQNALFKNPGAPKEYRVAAEILLPTPMLVIDIWAKINVVPTDIMWDQAFAKQIDELVDQLVQEGRGG